MKLELAYPGGVTGSAIWDMNATGRTMTWTVIGNEGTATSPAFGVPHQDNRLLLTRDGQTTAEPFGDQTSYTYQLANLARTLQDGAPFLVDIDDAVANAELIDECYRRAGLQPRGRLTRPAGRICGRAWPVVERMTRAGSTRVCCGASFGSSKRASRARPAAAPTTSLRSSIEVMSR